MFNVAPDGQYNCLFRATLNKPNKKERVVHEKRNI